MSVLRKVNVADAEVLLKILRGQTPPCLTFALCGGMFIRSTFDGASGISAGRLTPFNVSAYIMG